MGTDDAGRGAKIVDGPTVTCRSWVVFALSALLALPASTSAGAQNVDCAALRAEIDALRRPIDADRPEVAIRQQRLELQHDRDTMEDLGCNVPAAGLDDPDQPQCRTIARRVQRLEDGLQRLESQAAGAVPDDPDRRRSLTDRFNATCAVSGDETAGYPDLSGSAVLPGPEDAPTMMPVDPDVPAGPPDAARSTLSRVICVRQCDGAFYPLAVDVSPDRLDGLDQICKAQCPNAQASAYSLRADEEIGQAVAADGSTYQALPSAFAYQKATVPACSCRAANASWAETLAQAETMLEPQKGDVTVTPALAASMARPAVKPPTAAAAQPAASSPAQKPALSKKAARKKPTPTTTAVDSPDASIANPGVDITRQFRRAAPTL